MMNWWWWCDDDDSSSKVSKSKRCIGVSINLAFTATGNSHAIWDHTVLPATRQWWESRLYPQPKQVLNLATLEGCKAVLTYVMWKWTGWELNPRPVNCKSNALPLSHHATRSSGRVVVVVAVALVVVVTRMLTVNVSIANPMVTQQCAVLNVAFPLIGTRIYMYWGNKGERSELAFWLARLAVSVRASEKVLRENRKKEP